MAANDGHSIALDNFNQTVPPGWKPGILGYPVERYLELLDLWHQLTALDANKVAIAAMGRLQGRVHTLA